MEPVDPAEAPDYYKVIKEPMGKTIQLLLIFIKVIINFFKTNSRFTKN